MKKLISKIVLLGCSWILFPQPLFAGFFVMKGSWSQAAVYNQAVNAAFENSCKNSCRDELSSCINEETNAHDIVSRNFDHCTEEWNECVQQCLGENASCEELAKAECEPLRYLPCPRDLYDMCNNWETQRREAYDHCVARETALCDFSPYQAQRDATRRIINNMR